MKKFIILFSLAFISMALTKSVPLESTPSPQKINIYDSDYEHERSDGGMLKFSSFKGKVVLVHVWGSWCRTTKGRPEGLAELKKKINNPNFEIVHVSMDDNKTEWKQYIKNSNWKGHHILDPHDLSIPLSKVVYVPKREDGKTTYWINVDTYFLIYKNGRRKTLGKGKTNDQLETEIRMALSAE